MDDILPTTPGRAGSAPAESELDSCPAPENPLIFTICDYPRAMLDTSARLLRLLSLLQGAREWPGPELAQRLGVSTRTIRHDVERLRSLGYPVDASRGAVGGYRLGAGASMPPLLLDDEEAVAVAVSLRTAAGGTSGGFEEVALRALTKLQQVLPARLVRSVDALQSYTVSVLRAGPPAVDGATLTLIAAACRDREQLRFGYLDHGGASTSRRVEPHRLVHWGQRWYLLAWDLERADWRTFRVDRTERATGVGLRFAEREPPGGDPAAYLEQRARAAQVPFTAELLVHAPAAVIAERLGPSALSVELLDDERCLLTVGAGSAAALAPWLGFVGADFEILNSPELAVEVRLLAERYANAQPGRPA